MTKTYHLMHKEEWASLVHLFHPQHGSHYIDLPNGRILVATSFHSEGSEEMFHLKASTKVSLPHPVFEGTDLLKQEHLAEIGHLFTPDEAKKATVRDVVKKATAIHPLMRLSVF